MSNKKINWNKFRDDAAVSFFSAMLSNESLYNRMLNNSRFSTENFDDTLCDRALRYANKLTTKLKENKFENE